ncbi:MAG: hypothetical protein ACI9EW_001980 [Cellvibrionaceae bacterium]
MRWLFPDQEVRLDVICLASGAPITIRMKNDEILEITPDTVVGHLNVPFSKIATGEATSAFA